MFCTDVSVDETLAPIKRTDGKCFTLYERVERVYGREVSGNADIIVSP